MNQDIIFILFGATGDLATKKILPALENLHIDKGFSGRSRVIAVSRREWDTTAFARFYAESRKKTVDARFTKALQYVQVDIDAGTGYDTLAHIVSDYKKDMPQAQVLIYLSLAPQYHGKVSEALSRQGVLKPGKVKVLIEKPFGTDEVSARALDALLTNLILEQDIYRVDHYLGKQAAQDIMNTPEVHTGISSIYVRLYEEKGIDGRGASYDHVGAFRDVGQNHMLEMLALTLAQPLHGDWQKAREHIIQRLVPPEKTCIDFLRGQYVGYGDEKGVKPGSQTETAFRVVTMLERVSITLESGKKMNSNEASIRITYKNGSEKIFDFRQGRDAYETVILEAIAGSKRTFVGFTEVLALWNYADHVQGCWEKVPLQIYSKEKPFLVQ